MARWSVVAYVALTLERLAQAAQVFPRPIPALVRRHQAVELPLRLEQPYYAAQHPQKGTVFIPVDRYTLEAETILADESRTR
jgi:hypothetical protein